MDYALELLKRDLETLEYAYDKFVINGTVNIESEVAKENRERVNDVKNAITILNKQAESKQLNMHDVSNSVCENMDENRNCKLMCLTRCIENNRFI